MSIIEFSLKKGVDVERALDNVSKILPEDARVIQIQQPALFAQQIYIQMLSFLSFWSLAVYAVIASASYIAAAMLVEESYYEILLLKVLGAKGKPLFAFIPLYMVIVAAVSSVLGISIGLVGTQMVSASLFWLMSSIRITPLLEPWQAIWVLFTTISSAIIGCLYPAYKATKIKYVGKTL